MFAFVRGLNHLCLLASWSSKLVSPGYVVLPTSSPDPDPAHGYGRTFEQNTRQMPLQSERGALS